MWLFPYCLWYKTLACCILRILWCYHSVIHGYLLQLYCTSFKKNVCVITFTWKYAIVIRKERDFDQTQTSPNLTDTSTQLDQITHDWSAKTWYPALPNMGHFFRFVHVLALCLFELTQIKTNTTKKQTVPYQLTCICSFADTEVKMK